MEEEEGGGRGVILANWSKSQDASISRVSAKVGEN